MNAPICPAGTGLPFIVREGAKTLHCTTEKSLALDQDFAALPSAPVPSQADLVGQESGLYK
jgi:hypothetical protein